jgi:hypothetical protein
MMTLLVRSELLHSKPIQYSVPVETVMQKMFDGQETSDLVISYEGSQVGECSIRIVKDKTKPSSAYLVKSNLKLDFDVFGKQVRLQSSTDSEFDPKYQMTSFHSLTTTGDSKIELQGDLASKEVQLVLHFGDVREKHVLPFAMLEKMGPSGAMGLFGMGGLQLPQSAQEMEKNTLPSLTGRSKGPITTVEDTYIVLGKDKLSTLVVQTKYDDTLWSRVYVSPQGEILKVDTSFGVTMSNSQFVGVGSH